jgi:hypothetical protein
MLKFRHISALIVAAALIVSPTVAHAVPAQNSTVQPATVAKFTATPVPTVSGRANVGATLTVNVGNWIPAPDTTEIKWMVGTTVVGVDPTYSVQSTDRGKNITVSVTASAAGYQSVTKTSAKLVATGLLAPSGDPQIASVVHQGDVLTATVPTFDPVPSSVKYQWYRAGVAIAGATKVTYTSVAADLNKSLTFKVTATLASYDALTLTSNASEPVVLNGFGLTNAPTLSNMAPTFGNVITGSVAAWSPVATSLAYQWFRDATAIAGATKATYTATVADIGHSLKLRVTGAKVNYAATALFSDPTDPVIAATLTSSAAPAISGLLISGKTLTAAPGTWTPKAAKLSYKWLRNGEYIPGAIAATYKLAIADVMSSISVEVTGALAGYDNRTVTSEATASIQGAFATTPKPTITGAFELDGELFANVGNWVPMPDSFTYQWYENGLLLDGLTDPSITLDSSDPGKKISVRVTGHKADYADVTVVSADVKWTPKTYTYTLSVADVYNACSNAGSSYEPCDIGMGQDRIYSDGEGDSTVSFGITLPKAPINWKVTFKSLNGEGAWWDYWASSADGESTDADMSFYPSWTAASKTSPASTIHDGARIYFLLNCTDWVSVYFAGVTITYTA